MILRSFAALLASAFVALMAAPALAQDQSQPATSAATQAPMGANETKNVGDWLVRCFPVKSPSPCDMFELLADKKTGQRVLSLSIAYIPSQDRDAIQIALPLGVALSRGVIMSADTFATQQMRYRRCDRMGCYVEGLVDNATIDNLARSQSGAKVKFTAYGGQTYDLPFSLKGFSEARDTMVGLARSHVAMAGGHSEPKKPAATP